MEPQNFDFNSRLRLFKLHKGRTLVLVHHDEDHPSTDVGQEVVMKVQGYLLDCSMPPVRRFQLPRNLNRLIDLRQFVTLTGLGAPGFENAVRGLSTIYQNVKALVMRRGGQLREWTPGEDGGHLTMTFGSRYLTASKDVADDDIHPDLAEVVDPFNVLRPLLRTEVHTLDNCVQYWQRKQHLHHGGSGYNFEKVKLEVIGLSNMIEVQFAVHVIKVGRQDYIFLPKLRAICLFGKQAEQVFFFPLMYGLQDHNLASIRAITARRVISPLKKVKRKVGYGPEDSEGDADGPAEPPQKAMRRLTLQEGASGDVSMRSDSK
ncbi:hypothetical protein L226DRAFT_474417 [Lentinus tigrinus ALCF2SS1-7]|uniref:uncharacterized protein n=1 Tax=Lentinus tigrinus ALCF2SS1-7 TaxID=1328758 RepID=UPI001165F4F9|nr:hypothetical protein L226DRAFT_474417 [Lentinus tigrinus ALCF2SS1-7]